MTAFFGGERVERREVRSLVTKQRSQAFVFLKRVLDEGIGDYMGTQQKCFQHHGGKKGDKWGWDWIRDLG